MKNSEGISAAIAATVESVKAADADTADPITAALALGREIDGAPGASLPPAREGHVRLAIMAAFTFGGETFSPGNVVDFTPAVAAELLSFGDGRVDPHPAAIAQALRQAAIDLLHLEREVRFGNGKELNGIWDLDCIHRRTRDARARCEVAVAQFKRPLLLTNRKLGSVPALAVKPVRDDEAFRREVEKLNLLESLHERLTLEEAGAFSRYDALRPSASINEGADPVEVALGRAPFSSHAEQMEAKDDRVDKCRQHLRLVERALGLQRYRVEAARDRAASAVLLHHHRRERQKIATRLAAAIAELHAVREEERKLHEGLRFAGYGRRDLVIGELSSQALDELGRMEQRLREVMVPETAVSVAA